MSENNEFQSDDLVLFVWPRQSEPQVRTGEQTWKGAASGDWAMDAAKADRVKVVVAVHDDDIRGAWSVEGVRHNLEVPMGKTRNVNRSTFWLVDNDRLAYLDGARSPLPRRRNPQTTIELRDLPGAHVLLGDRPPKSMEGVAHVGAATVSARYDGSIDVVVPAGTVVTVRTFAAGEDESAQ